MQWGILLSAALGSLIGITVVVCLLVGGCLLLRCIFRDRLRALALDAGSPPASPRRSASFSPAESGTRPARISTPTPDPSIALLVLNGHKLDDSSVDAHNSVNSTTGGRPSHPVTNPHFSGESGAVQQGNTPTAGITPKAPSPTDISSSPPPPVFVDASDVLAGAQSPGLALPLPSAERSASPDPSALSASPSNTDTASPSGGYRKPRSRGVSRARPRALAIDGPARVPGVDVEDAVEDQFRSLSNLQSQSFVRHGSMAGLSGPHRSGASGSGMEGSSLEALQSQGPGGWTAPQRGGGDTHGSVLWGDVRRAGDSKNHVGMVGGSALSGGGGSGPRGSAGGSSAPGYVHGAGAAVSSFADVGGLDSMARNVSWPAEGPASGTASGVGVHHLTSGGGAPHGSPSSIPPRPLTQQRGGFDPSAGAAPPTQSPPSARGAGGRGGRGDGGGGRVGGIATRRGLRSGTSDPSSAEGAGSTDGSRGAASGGGGGVHTFGGVGGGRVRQGSEQRPAVGSAVHSPSGNLVLSGGEARVRSSCDTDISSHGVSDCEAPTLETFAIHATQSKLGSGAGGTVHKGADTRWGSFVAIKRMPPGKMAVQELYALLRLPPHPHVVHVIAIFVGDELITYRDVPQALYDDAAGGLSRETSQVGFRGGMDEGMRVLRRLDSVRDASAMLYSQQLSQDEIAAAQERAMKAWDLSPSAQVTVVMEWMPGGTFIDVMRQQRMSLRPAQNYLRGICRGLEHLHQNGLLHRDIKPANVMLNDRGIAKLADFGVAIAVEIDYAAGDGQKGFEVQLEGQQGTEAYLAPEALCGTKLQDAASGGRLITYSTASDVWSFGLLTAVFLLRLKGPEDLFRCSSAKDLTFHYNMLLAGRMTSPSPPLSTPGPRRRLSVHVDAERRNSATSRRASDQFLAPYTSNPDSKNLSTGTGEGGASVGSFALAGDGVVSPSAGGGLGPQGSPVCDFGLSPQQKRAVHHHSHTSMYQLDSSQSPSGSVQGRSTSQHPHSPSPHSPMRSCPSKQAVSLWPQTAQNASGSLGLSPPALGQVTEASFPDPTHNSTSTLNKVDGTGATPGIDGDSGDAHPHTGQPSQPASRATPTTEMSSFRSSHQMVGSSHNVATERGMSLGSELRGHTWSHHLQHLPIDLDASVLPKDRFNDLLKLSEDAAHFVAACLMIHPWDRPSTSALLGHPFLDLTFHRAASMASFARRSRTDLPGGRSRAPTRSATPAAVQSVGGDLTVLRSFIE